MDCKTNKIEELIALMAKLPGLGPRSARRAVLRMIKKREIIMKPLGDMIQEVSSLAQGVPIGGELDYLDEGTISAALRARINVT